MGGGQVMHWLGGMRTCPTEPHDVQQGPNTWEPWDGGLTRLGHSPLFLYQQMPLFEGFLKTLGN